MVAGTLLDLELTVILQAGITSVQGVVLLRLFHFRLLPPSFLPRLPRAPVHPTPVPQGAPAVLLRAQGRVLHLWYPPMAADITDGDFHHLPSHGGHHTSCPRVRKASLPGTEASILTLGQITLDRHPYFYYPDLRSLYADSVSARRST